MKMRCSSVISFLLLLILCSSPWISADSGNDFTAGLSLDLYKAICSKNVGKNLFFSPLSVSTAFGMVHLGAKGNTKTQLKSVLKLNSFNSDDAINADFERILQTLNQQDGNYTVYLVNRLFGSDAFAFNSNFLENCHKYFNSTMQRMDFRQKPDESRIDINNWVSNQTNGKIKDLLLPGNVQALTTLVIVNAVYFKAIWKNPFDPKDTKLGPFKISTSESVDMNMMHLPAKYLNYYDATELNSEILELPFLGDKASMFIILPREVGGLPVLENKLTPETLMVSLKKVGSAKVIVTLPRFTMDQKIPLKQYLQSLGLTDVFEASKSDLSGIVDGGGRLYASDAAHKAYVNVNEFGVEAAAATAVPILPGSAPTTPVDFNVDRPFLFLIKAKDTDAILFLGRMVRSPTTNEALGVFGESAALTDGSPTFRSTSLAVWMALLLVSSLLAY